MTADAWRHAASEIAAGRATLFGLWGDNGDGPVVHMAMIDDATGEIAVVSLACPAGKFPSVGALHPPAIRLERALHSLYGFEPVGAPDTRPWLDLGFWDVQHPLGARAAAPAERTAYAFLPAEGEACTKFPSVRCMPASSSRDISASPPAARRWCGSRSASAMCTRASSR